MCVNGRKKLISCIVSLVKGILIWVLLLSVVQPKVLSMVAQFGITKYGSTLLVYRDDHGLSPL